MYKLYTRQPNTVADACMKFNVDGSVTSFIFAPDNTDYTNFKKEILADKAQLQDAEGDTMSAAEAKAYVATLP